MFEFVLSYIDIVDTSTIELIDNHFIRKANVEELVHINRELSLLKTSFIHSTGYTTIYEHEIIKNHNKTKLEHLSKEKWKYYIIDYSKSTKNNNEIRVLEKALILLKESIYLGFSLHTHTWFRSK